MVRIEIIAAGKMKAAPLLSLWEMYLKRMQWPVTLHEITGHSAKGEQRKLLAKIKNDAYLFVMDERGQNLDSVKFSENIQQAAMHGQKTVQFVIGGADGHSEEIRKRADCLLSLGKMTWPHMLARIMLMEQIYRAQQISLGHPYHRD